MPESLEYIIRLRGGKEGAADVKLLEHEVDKLGGTVRRQNAETDASTTKLGRWSTAMDRAGKSAGKLGGLATAALTLGPALVPVLATATAAVGTLGAAFGGAGAGAALFGGIFISQMHAIGQASKQLDAVNMRVAATYGPQFATQHTAALKQQAILNRQLTAQFGAGGPAVVSQFTATGNAFQAFKQSFNPQILQLLTIGLATIQKLLPAIHPLLLATANAFISVARSIDKGIGGPGFRNFMAWMTANARPGILAFAHIIGNLAIGFVNLIRAFNPMASGMRSGLVGMTRAFRDWAAHLGTNAGFQKFLAYVRVAGPQVLHVLGGLVTGIISLAPVLAGAGQSSLLLLNGVIGLVHWLGQWPVVGAFVGQMIPFLIVGSKLIPVIGGIAKALKFLALDAIPFLLSPLGLLLVATVLITVLLLTHWKQFQRGLARVWTWMKTAAGDVIRFLKTNWPTILAVLTGPVGLAALLIYKNFGAIKHFIGGIGKALASAGRHMWDWMLTGLKAVGNAVIWILNHTLVAGINAIVSAAYKVDSALPFGGVLPGGLHVPQIPALAKGGNIQRGGHALVGDHGPEILNLPQGAQVTPLAPGSLAGWGSGDIVLKIDGRELARVQARQNLMASAAGA